MAGLIQDEQYHAREVAPFIDGDRVDFRGVLGGNDRVRALGHARAMLHLIGFEEPFGLSVVEAMACGTPVIAYRRGSMPELIDDGQNGLLVDAGDAAAMARQIDQILQNPDLRARLGGQAAATAAQRYDLRQTVARYLEWYAILTENKS